MDYADPDLAREDAMGDPGDSRTASVSGGVVIIGTPTFKRSASIAALAGALAKAQGEISGASKDKTNPHFKSSYADLASVWEACREPLSKAGIAVLQPVLSEGPRVTVTTLLAHGSGEWISTDLTMAAQQNTPQAVGSCITYARRYALASMVGVAPEDDDAEAAHGRANGNGHAQTNDRRAEAPVPPPKYAEWVTDLTATADSGMVALTKAFNDAKPEYRNQLTRQENVRWEALKARAAKVKASA